VEDLTQREQELRAQATGIRGKLQDLQAGLREVDGELEALKPRRDQHELLDAACGSLGRLDELGAATLFWGERVRPEDAAAILGSARERADAFNAGLKAISQRRQMIVDGIAAHEEALEILGGDLYQLREEEERRKLEWLVERDISEVPSRATVMPWSRHGEEDSRLRRSLVAALAASLLAAAVLPMIELPMPKRFQPEDVPQRLAQLVRKELPKPPVTETRPEQPEPSQAQQQKPLPQDQERPAEKPPQPADEGPALAAAEPAPQQRVQKAGILAFKDKFAGLAKGDVAPKLAEGARFRGTEDSGSGPPARAMLTSNAPGNSGGINLASLSRNVGGGGSGGAGGGGGGMHGVAIGRATSAIGSIGGGGGAGGDRPRAGGGASLSRTDEEIQIVFDRYKAAFYRLYNRELRKDATLRGQMILRLTIEPDGRVSMCELYDSDMDAPLLADQVVERVRSIDFGAKEGVQALTIVYPIDFLPAA